MEVRRWWTTTINVLNDKNYQSGILYPVKITFKHKGEKTPTRFLKNQTILCQQTCPTKNTNNVLQTEGK